MTQLTESHLSSIKTGTPKAVSPPAWATAARNLLWFCIACAGMIVLLEGFFLIFHLGEEEVVRLRPVTGFGLVADRLITWRSEGYSQDRTNHLGMRNREISLAKQPGTQRIALFGDSVVEALQVPLKKTFGQLLERSLNEKNTQSEYEVLNFGNSAYSTVQEYYRYIHEAAAFKPDLVILFYHNGDNEKNMTIEGAEKFLPRPYAKIDSNGNLVADWDVYQKYMNSPAYEKFQSQEFLRNNSRIFGVWSKTDMTLGTDKWYGKVKEILAKTGTALSPLKANKNNGEARQNYGEVPDLICSKEEMFKIDQILRVPAPPASFLQKQAEAEAKAEAAVQATTNPAQAQEQTVQRYMSTQYRGILRIDAERLRVTAGLLHALNRECKKNGARLVVVCLPTQNNSLLFFRQFNILEKLGQQIGFECFNLHKHFPAFSPDLESDYFYYAGIHMNSKGHKLAADRLEQFLQEKHLLP